MTSPFEQARQFFLDGLAHYQAGRLEQAERQFAAALSLAPGRPSVLTNLGAVRLKLGRAEEALVLLEEALAQEPGNVEALGHAATALAELGEHARALAMFDRALALHRALPALWTLRGSVLREMGRPAEAAESFGQAIAHGGDPHLNGFYLAGVGGAREVPPASPREYVEALFDGYAVQFDSHLVQALKYDAPRILAQPLLGGGGRYRHALDLGCGTGLCGRLLRPACERITGIDLSANMIGQANAGGGYDALVQADVLEFLKASNETFDLVIAADVFIYVGALDGVFAELARVVSSGGRFCFTVEEATGAELELRASLRYAHSEALLRRLAAEHGFVITALERGPVREEQRQPIAGLFVWMEKV
jgi:predicted TPR repeat methyltransferase